MLGEPTLSSRQGTGTAPASRATRWARPSWLAVLAAGVLVYLVVLRVLVRTENLNSFPALLLIGSITVPLTGS